MAAAKGNQYTVKAKVWTAAIHQALTERMAEGRLKGLHSLAEKLLDRCEEGDLASLKELGDRLEGKPVQQIEGGDPSRPLIIGIRELVRLSDKEGKSDEQRSTDE